MVKFPSEKQGNFFIQSDSILKEIAYLRAFVKEFLTKFC